MERLISGVVRFQNEVFPRRRELFQRLAGEQNPSALVITCADSRVVPNLIMQAPPGEIFLCRNAGNMVPAWGGDHAGGVSATIEYAVRVLAVPHIIVLGHSDCGAMKGVLHPENLTDMPCVQSWLRNGEMARQVVVETRPGLEDEELLGALTEENVLAQLDHLRTHPCVAPRLKSGKLQIHGWVYDIETAQIRTYDAEAGAFVPLVTSSEEPGTAVDESGFTYNPRAAAACAPEVA